MKTPLHNLFAHFSILCFRANLKIVLSLPILGLMLLLASCEKRGNLCSQVTTPGYYEHGFKILEPLADTLMETDTAYTNRLLAFKGNANYNNISWTIGNDPRRFSTQIVRLTFPSTGRVTAKLSAEGENRNCQLVQFTKEGAVELVKDDGTVVSPLRGDYLGYNTDNPIDTFTVSIKFWKGSRYPFWSEGAYSVDNLPKGHKDTTKEINGLRRPEIEGIFPRATGYKNIAINETGFWFLQHIKGYGQLKRGIRDTLVFNYTQLDTLRVNQTGQYVYFRKKFVGIRK
jgi:hypothetical protein